MQKKIIALAIAGLASSAAFAQTNVTIYGVVDLAYGNFTSDNNAAAGDYKFSGIGAGGLSGPRLGFKATEDLGNGWSAGTLLEFGTLSPDGGGASGAGSVSGLASSRQTYLFLSNNSMGTFQMGRLYNPGTNISVQYDAEGASTFGPVSRFTTNLGLGIDGAGNNAARQNNSVAWLSPNWSGFTAQVQYSFGENGEATTGDNTTKDGSSWGAGVNYAKGPLSVGFAYHDASDFGGKSQLPGAVPGIDVQEWFLGASYDFGMLKLFGSYQDFDIENTNRLASGDTSANIAAASNGSRAKSEGDIWNVGVTIPVMKAGTVTLSYADLSRDQRNNAGVKSNGDADGWGISYRHALSKRTTAYVGYVSMDNNRNSQIRAGNIVNAPGAGQDSTGYAMGMRHTF